MGEIGKVTLEVHSQDRPRSEHTNGTQKAEQCPGTSEDMSGRDRLVERYLPLVYRLCRTFIGSGEPPDDLAQVGMLGLLKAIEKFDPTRGVSFITYAVPVILGEIKNYLRDYGWTVKVPRKIQRHKLAVQRAVETLSQMFRRSPTVQEIAEATGLSQEEVFDTFEVTKYSRPLSLDIEYDSNGSGETSCLLDWVGSEDPRFERLSDRIDLANGLRFLGTREKTILYLKFYVGLSQTDIAKRLDISQMHVSRLQRNSLSKLKQSMTK